MTAGTGVRVGGVIADLDSVAIEDNRALYGAGIQVAYDATVVIRNSRVTDNSATIAGGGAVLQAGAVLTSENTTWEGNLPDDIVFATLSDDPDEVIVHATWSADGATDFTCTFDTLTCE